MSIDDFVRVVTVVSPIVLAIIVYFTARQGRVVSIANAGKLDDIHVLVNSRLTDALAKINELEAHLQAVTGAVPTGAPPPALKSPLTP